MATARGVDYRGRPLRPYSQLKDWDGETPWHLAQFAIQVDRDGTESVLIGDTRYPLTEDGLPDFDRPVPPE